jgi:ubiquinone/menaquinone biosynthesis C-methylase UbiE
MSRLENKRYYDDFSARYEEQRGKPYHRFLDESEIAAARPYCEGKRVLEVGCGTGLVLEPLARMASFSAGIDLSSGMLGKARQRGLAVARASATSLPFADRGFDCVVSFKVLAHVEHIRTAVAECARVVKPGGHMVLEFYNKGSLRRMVKGLKPRQKVAAKTTDDQVYTRYDSLADIRHYLPEGCTVEKVVGIRCLAPTYHFFNVPVLGRVTVALERMLQKTSFSRVGGFLVVVIRKDR